MRLTVSASVLFWGLLTLAAASSGADDDGVVPGTRVRLSAPELGAEPIVGRLVAIGPEYLSLDLPEDEGQETIPRSAVTRVEVSRGRQSQARHGALVGLGVGAAATVLLTFGDYSSDVHGDLNLLAIGAGLAAGGAAIGGIVGSTRTAEQWEVVALDPVSVAVGPAGGRGVGVTVRLAWGRRPGWQQ